MNAESFIDTNVFIYHLDHSDAAKQRVAEQIVRSAIRDGNACISFQVVQECLNTAMRKAKVALPADAARAYLDNVLIPLLRVPASASLYHRAIGVQERWRFSFYDALIVAAALSAGCTRLISEDLQDGQRVESLTIYNPFEA